MPAQALSSATPSSAIPSFLHEAPSDAPRRARRAWTEPLASVVVPTCRRPHLLSHCLAHLLLQRFDPLQFEIIVVDDAPTQGTCDLVADWARLTMDTGPAIRYIASPGPHGPAAARNCGWRAARGLIIAFTDDDTVARPDWLYQGICAFGPQVQAAWGRIVMPVAARPTDYERDAQHLERAEFVTANCFCTRQALEQLGGFDERFRLAWREDADLYFRLLANACTVVHAPAAVVTHPVRPAWWGVSLSQQKKILFDALLFKKHPALYRQKIRARPRWDYYLIVAAAIAGMATAAAGLFAAAAAAGGLWLILTMRFCLGRLAHTDRSANHVAEMLVTSALIPPLAVFWRIVGAIRFRAALL